jgi:hypothetical protein
MAAEIGRLRAQIKDEAVCELASNLNNGTLCIIGHPPRAVGPGSLTGRANYHARIHFADGSRSWLMRVPRFSDFFLLMEELPGKPWDGQGGTAKVGLEGSRQHLCGAGEASISESGGSG